MLGFQHESLSKSPLENAVALLTALTDVLSKGDELHLVSHSRGGLVGEILARSMRVGAAPFTAASEPAPEATGTVRSVRGAPP